MRKPKKFFGAGLGVAALSGPRGGGGEGPPPSVWPNASNTGVPAGTSLTVRGSDWNIEEDGAVIDGYDIHGALTIRAKNVTITNCKAYILVTDAENHDVSGLTIEHCEFIGYEGDSLNGIEFVGADNGAVRYCNIHDSENGIWLQSDNATIEHNFIHTLGKVTADDPHVDGIQVPGLNLGLPSPVTGCTIRGNNVDVHDSYHKASGGGSEPYGANAAFTGADFTDFIITANRFNGGGWVVQFTGAPTGNVTTNNVFGPDAAYGPFTGDNNDYIGTNTFSGNIFEADGSTAVPT